MHALTRTAITHGLRPLVTPTTDLDTMTESERCALALKKWPHLATVADDPSDAVCGTCSGSGEGMYDGTTCSACSGTGSAHEAARRRDDDDAREYYRNVYGDD